MRAMLLKALTRAKSAKSVPKTTSQIVYTLLYNQHIGSVIKYGNIKSSTVDGSALGVHFWVESFGYVIDYEVYNMLNGAIGKDGIMSIEELKSIGLIYSGHEVKPTLISNEVINFLTASSDIVLDSI